MSWGINIVGRDKAKLKAAIVAQQCKDEATNPHSGVPKRVVDFLCSEIDRVRVYTFQDQVYGLKVDASGSFHEQGITERIDITSVRLVE